MTKKNEPISYIELSKSNLIHNFKELKKITKKGVEIAAVIKGNAYGHGQNEIAKILDPFVDYFQVNSLLELELLRKVTKKKIFLLGYVQKEDLKKAIKLGCILSIFSLEQLKDVEKVSGLLKVKQEIHIPIDAYLGREGFLESEWKNSFEEVKKCKNVKLGGIYAHFANIEDTNNFTHARKQINKYKHALDIAGNLGFEKIKTHISATSGLLVYEKDKGPNSVIRLGIGIYGMWPSEHIKYLYKNKFELKPVMEWKTKIAQIKTLPAGHTVGYGLTYMTYNPTKIAVIPIGYSDGFDRGLSNKGEVLIHGTRCKILGRVAMNMFVVDVTHLVDVKAEDEVILIGKQGKEQITAEEIADKLETINYEVTTRINSLLPRVII
ncbi:MAG TPA: alanine racemase [Candidatus Paceibacterota bacterium]|nr:alanine racemase [Candidatus Paceibacterota bacterium]HPT18121.1 alanine racemase [Candidatus Paceibacterota bacterium]